MHRTSFLMAAALMSSVAFAKAGGAGSAKVPAPFVADADQTNFLNALANNDFLHVAVDYAAPIVAAGLIETNPDMKDESGNVAARITDAGREFVASNGSQPEGNTETVSDNASDFEIEDDVEMVKGRVTGRKAKYPFDSLGAPVYDTVAKRWKFQSFHVAATPDNEKPAENLASTVSGATDRFAELAFNTDGSPVMTEKRQKNAEGVFVKVPTQAKNKTRVFTVQAVGDTDKKGPGARVFRTDGLTATSPAPSAPTA